MLFIKHTTDTEQASAEIIVKENVLINKGYNKANINKG